MIQKITPKNSPIDAEIIIPGSKSITNRVLLMAALAEGESKLSGVLYSDDTKVMAEALNNLGVLVDLESIKKNGEVNIQGCAGRFPQKTARIYTHESGTATRFLIPAVAACGRGEYYFHASPRMMERPLENQLLALSDLGVNFKFEKKTNSLPLWLETGGLEGEEVLLDINQTSQFLSGLMMALPYSNSHSNKSMILKSAQNFANKPYVHMTKALMQEFGVEIDIISDQEIKINASNKYQDKYQGQKFFIEPDMSTASYFFAIPALLGGRIYIKNTARKCLQGDAKFLEVLEKMGCEVFEEERNGSSGITVIGLDRLDNLNKSNQKLKGLEIDMAGFSDTFMTVAALACFADGPTTLHSLAHTRLQESDRVFAMSLGLEKLGVKTKTSLDSLTIFPPESLDNFRGALVNSFNDHRIAMSLSLIGLKIPGVEIENSEAVKDRKSVV